MSGRDKNSRNRTDLIVLKKVGLGYGENEVIRGLDFSVREGDFICIVGQNGSGKTTLIRGILGLIPVKTGEIRFKMSRNEIGYMPQETSVDPNFPAEVVEIVLSGALGTGRNFYDRKTRERAGEMLDILGISQLIEKGFSELSGGQRQKVLLARALMATRKILILDEPSNNLDRESKRELYEILRKLNKERGIAVVMVTHDLDHGNLIGNKILAIGDGKYFFGGTAEYVRKVHHKETDSQDKLAQSRRKSDTEVEYE